jgi:hypothetical protein
MEALLVQSRCGEEEHVPYSKPPRLLDLVNEDLTGCIREIFVHLHLDDLCDEINQWMEVALINEDSAYSEGAQRQDLMDFCYMLQLLAEAMHVINEKRKPADADAWKQALPEAMRAEIDRYNHPVLLTKRQLADPLRVIRDFYSKFSMDYVRRELWDMLDAVIGYEGDRAIRGVNLLMGWECMSALVECAYLMYQA